MRPEYNVVTRLYLSELKRLIDWYEIAEIEGQTTEEDEKLYKHLKDLLPEGASE